MFYSHVLLSKKGALGNIWVAAHCHKRLNKYQVSQTNISSSVDKILLDEVPVVTYRILGHLLVGIVRIYSKKVEYLFHDCHKVLTKLVDFASEKRPNKKFKATHSSYCLISRPKRFELDAFELEILDDQDGLSAHVRPNEEIMLSDAWKSDGLRIGLSDLVSEQYHDQEDISHPQSYSPDHTPLRDVCSPHFVEDDVTCGSTSYKTNSIGMGRLCVTRFSLEECLEPMTFEDIENQMINDQESSQICQTDEEQIKQPDSGSCNLTEIGNFCTFLLEDRLEPMIIDDEEAEAEAALAHEQIKHPETKMLANEEELLNKSCNGKQPVDVESMNIQEMPSSNSGKHQILENHSVSLSVDVTPNSKFPGGSGAASPDLMLVRTPATKERPRTLKKRKCLFDEPVVIPNQVFKRWLNNYDDLVCKRRKAPHIPLVAWKVQKFSSLPESLLEPLIPCSALVDTRLLVHKIGNRAEPVDCVEVPQNKGIPESPAKHGSQEHTPIAPGTPVTFSNAWRLHEARRCVDILEPASSIDKSAQQAEVHELDISLMDEEINSFDEDIQEKYKCSVRTRKVARYLHRNFLAQNGEAVNLSQALKVKTKKASARLFYEILVLKTGGWIDVQQDNAYGDICVLESPNLKQTFAAEVAN
ncbi:PREDICTED: sister chromatid cohesion 1 protein 2 isoform X2 [Ipomoea nil]|uniref:sister chromatid cohesion 1 protein 2 isoform X2 n=1 Tax=Ipomoea nil TaxID=35883 RepID=UPI0009015446|nr:PREDICTED: sister chromatid cohesion 1 protein 2 isoform X2 [Ipomoea nil]